jgi:large subunit ribosomal protein L18
MSNRIIKSTARRKGRTRYSVKASAHGRPRLSVFRSGRHIYAQIIADAEGKTLAAASSVDAGVKKDKKKGNNKDTAAEVGKLLAERAVKAGVKEVVFDRGSYLYHGRIKALADAAREAGLSF